MSTGTTDEAIFGSPELSEFCFPNGKRGGTGGHLRPQWSSGGSDTSSQTNNNNNANQLGVPGAPPSESGSSSTSDPINGCDGEDILGLISSSLDTFNAQLHCANNNYANRDALNVPTAPRGPNFADPGLPPWITSADFNQSGSCQSHRCGSPSLVLSALQSDLPRFPSSQNSCPTSSFMGCVPALQQQNHPQRPLYSPPGLPRLASTSSSTSSCCSSTAQPSNTTAESMMIRPQRKQRNFSQPLSGQTEDASSLWESHWNALSADMGIMSVDSGIGVENLFNLNWPSNDSTAVGGGNTSPGDAPPPQTGSFDFSGLDGTLRQNAPPPPPLKQPQPAVATANEAGRSRLLSLCPTSWPQHHQQQQTHYMSGDPSQNAMALFEAAAAAAALSNSMQQRSATRPPSLLQTGRRKAESVCYSSTTRINPAPPPLFPLSGGSIGSMRSHSLAAVVGQLGSPPPTDLQLGMSPQKFTSNSRDLPTQRLIPNFGKSTCGLLSAPPLSQSRGVPGCLARDGRRMKKMETVSAATPNSNNPSGSTDKPVLAKWRRACSFYLRGHCKKEDCEFAHDLTKVTCKFWEAGECFKGITCPFLHGYPPELLLETAQQQRNNPTTNN